MGCINSDSNQPLASSLEPTSCLTVASLNYCGIMNSPFEFYCDDYLTELKDIGKIFLQLLPTYFPEFEKSTWKWNMGKIDLKFRHRYSPMFELKCGINENQTIMTQEEFQAAWENVFEQQIPKLKVEYNPEQKEVTKKYDILMFHSLLKYVYNIVEIKDVAGESASKYCEKLKPLYTLSFLDEQRKAVKVRDNFKRINADVFFFQEFSQNFYEAVKKTDQYHLSADQSKDTLIVVKKSSFKEKPASNDIFIESFMGQDLYKKLNWNQRSAFMIIDKHIFINAHLSSKAERNKGQIDELKAGVTQLKTKLPDYEIIVAGDLNSYLDNFSKDLHFFPLTAEEMTTVKKRTFTQGQFNKAQKVVRESKDKVVSTLKIKDGKVSYITGKEPSNQNLVPTDEHPFDHFVIVCQLERKN